MYERAWLAMTIIDYPWGLHQRAIPRPGAKRALHSSTGRRRHICPKFTDAERCKRSMRREPALGNSRAGEIVAKR